jgi:hypothetical protein
MGLEIGGAIMRRLSRSSNILLSLVVILTTLLTVITQAQPPGAVRELVDQRTATSKQWECQDGSRIAEISAGPIHYKAADGSWQEINTTLRRTAKSGYAYSVVESPIKTHFATNTGEFNSLEFNGRLLEIAAKTSVSVKGILEGDSIVYSGVWPDVDIKDKVFFGGLKEDIILNKPSAITNFQFTVRTGGLTPRYDESGAIEFVDEQSSSCIIVTAPLMYDANGKSSDSIKLTWATGPNDTIIISVQPDQEWLTDAAYPVTIDPSWTISSPDDSYFEHTEGQTGSWITDSTLLRIGRYNGKSEHTCIKFNLSTIPPGSTITYAYVQVYSYAGSGSYSIQLKEILQDKPWPSDSLPTLSSVIASQSWSSSGTHIFSGMAIDSMVQRWYNNSSFGMQLNINPEEDEAPLMTICSSEGGSNGPKLYVTFTPPVPPAPSITDDGDFTNDNSKLKATYSPIIPGYEPITQFQYAIGTTAPNPSYPLVVDWTTIPYNFNVTSTRHFDDGKYYFYMKAQNASGWGAVGCSNGIVVDTTGPTASVFYINNNAATTDTTAVTLTVIASDGDGIGIDQMQISNDGVFDTEPWESYSKQKQWTLYGADHENKTVYARFKDKYGWISSSVYSDTIYLDDANSPLTFDPPGNRKFFRPVGVKITCSLPTYYKIYYTVDGSDPTPTNPECREYDDTGVVVVVPTVNPPKTLKARVYVTEGGDYFDRSAYYELNEDETQDPEYNPVTSPDYIWRVDNTVTAPEITNLKLTDICITEPPTETTQLKTLNLNWLGQYKKFEVKRKLANDVTSWDQISLLHPSDQCPTVGQFGDKLDFTSGTSYKYAVRGIDGAPSGIYDNLPLKPAHISPSDPHVYHRIVYSTNTSAWKEIEVTPIQSIVTENQAVDSRLDNRCDDEVYANFQFQNRVYRGGLFVGYANDPSRVGRSFLKFALDQVPPSGKRLWASSLNAFYTRSFLKDVTTSVACEYIPNNLWQADNLMWQSDNPNWTAPTLHPNLAKSFVNVIQANDNPTPQHWCVWHDMNYHIVSELYGNHTLSVGLLAKDEDKFDQEEYKDNIGWAYFAKKEFNTLLAPQVLYAYGDAPIMTVGVTLDNTSVKGGYVMGGTIRLNAPAPEGGINVSIYSSDDNKAIVSPYYIVIPHNESTGRFVVSTAIIPQGGSATTVNISASSASGSIPSGSAVLEITP